MPPLCSWCAKDERLSILKKGATSDVEEATHGALELRRDGIQAFVQGELPGCRSAT